jgi:hypothetical protein
MTPIGQKKPKIYGWLAIDSAVIGFAILGLVVFVIEPVHAIYGIALAIADIPLIADSFGALGVYIPGMEYTK